MQVRAAVVTAFMIALSTAGAAAQQGPGTQPSPAQRVGNSAARIVIEEYSDLQCPFCADQEMRYAAALESWVRQQPGRYRFDYYDVVLPQHLVGAPAARAARCAGAQKRYAQARHAIFADQRNWSKAPNAVELVTGLARSVVPDSLKFDFCLRRDTSGVNRILAANLQRARDLEVPGTPTFVVFVGEKMAQIVDPASPDSIGAVIRSLQAKP